MFYHLQAMNMIFLTLVLICTFKDPNLAENLTNLSTNLFKKLNLAEFMELVFSKSGHLYCVIFAVAVGNIIESMCSFLLYWTSILLHPSKSAWTWKNPQQRLKYCASGKRSDVLLTKAKIILVINILWRVGYWNIKKK